MLIPGISLILNGRGRRCKISLVLQAVLLVCAVAAAPAARGAEGAQASAGGAATRPYVLHLPGVAGFAWVDRQMLKGLAAGGVEGEFHVFDWTGPEHGVPVLHAYEQNHLRAGKVAEVIGAERKAHPGGRIVVTSHSGGGGIAIWALEKLPEGVKVDDVLLLAPAVSPGYDLSKALKHVGGKMYVFYSSGDELILGIGCRMCGTMDGIMTDAAGLIGFSRPKTGDGELYRKLDQRAYDPAWLAFGNMGDHIGPMALHFSQNVLAPIVKGDVGAGQPASAK